MKDFPFLERYIGQELIVTDGTTLLGADDKAGVAEIVTACEHLLAHPEIRAPGRRRVLHPRRGGGQGRRSL